jgi:hypothetical protein
MGINTLISYIKNMEKINLIYVSYDKDKKIWERENKSVNGSVKDVFV